MIFNTHTKISLSSKEYCSKTFFYCRFGEIRSRAFDSTTFYDILNVESKVTFVRTSSAFGKKLFFECV